MTSPEPRVQKETLLSLPSLIAGKIPLRAKTLHRAITTSSLEWTEKSKQNEARLAQRPAQLQIKRAKGDHGDHEGVLAGIWSDTVVPTRSSAVPNSSTLFAHYGEFGGYCLPPSRRAVRPCMAQRGRAALQWLCPCLGLYD